MIEGTRLSRGTCLGSFCWETAGREGISGSALVGASDPWQQLTTQESRRKPATLKMKSEG